MGAAIFSVLYVLLSLFVVWSVKSFVTKMPFGLNIRKKSSTTHQAAKQAKKQDEIEREKSSNETSRLQAVISEKDQQIAELQQTVDECKKSAEKAQVEKMKLSTRLSAVTVELDQSHKVTAKFAEDHTELEQEISKLRRMLESESQNGDAVSRLELDYREVSESRDRLREELQQKEIDISKHLADLEELRKSVVTFQQKTNALEKNVSELRSERNQREARVLHLETELSQYELKWKETEVEVNRTRQNLSEVKHKCSSLTDELEKSRKTTASLQRRLRSPHHDHTEAMKKQLERLCVHIQQSEEKYIETISVYRSHLLKAASGTLDPQVASALREIQRLSPNPDEARPSSAEE